MAGPEAAEDRHLDHQAAQEEAGLEAAQNRHKAHQMGHQQQDSSREAV